jgi:hypothetical protein
MCNKIYCFMASFTYLSKKDSTQRGSACWREKNLTIVDSAVSAWRFTVENDLNFFVHLENISVWHPVDWFLLKNSWEFLHFWFIKFILIFKCFFKFWRKKLKFAPFFLKTFKIFPFTSRIIFTWEQKPEVSYYECN